MMEDAFTTAERIRDAVRTVELPDGTGERLKVYDDPKAEVHPPCAIVGLPELQLEGISSEPTAARFPVAIMVSDNKASANKLLKLVPLVATAIRELVEDAEIPGDIFPAIIEIGGTQLPGYMILVEV
jgi:hypothetical protein